MSNIFRSIILKLRDSYFKGIIMAEDPNIMDVWFKDHDGSHRILYNKLTKRFEPFGDEPEGWKYDSLQIFRTK